MITSITSTLIREGCSITSITSYIFGSNGSITSSLLQIVLHYYTITSITSSSLLHKRFHYFPLVGKVMGSNGSITSYYVPPQLGDGGVWIIRASKFVALENMGFGSPVHYRVHFESHQNTQT